MILYHSTLARPYVYCCRHRITGRYYIGYREQNVSLNVPSTTDIFRYKTSSQVVRSSFDEYDCVIIAEFDTGDSAYDFEQQLIFENWNDPLLINENCRFGGKRFKKNHCSQDTRDKISAKHKGKKLSQEHKLRISRSLIGNKKSQETKQRMQKPKSPEHANNIRLARIGTKISEATKKKQSLSKLNMDPDKRAAWVGAMSRARKGIVTAFDLGLEKIVKIPKAEFDLYKNIKYVGIKSKSRI